MAGFTLPSTTRRATGTESAMPTSTEAAAKAR